MINFSVCADFLLYRRRRSIWPIVVSLGNHVGDVRNSAAGKVVVGFIQLPAMLPHEKKKGVAQDRYVYCCRLLVQLVYRSLLDMVNNWSKGFLFVPDGSSTVYHFVPRIGLVSGDMKEIWRLGGYHAWYSPRCGTQVQFRVGARQANVPVAGGDGLPEEEVDTGPGVDDVNDDIIGVVGPAAPGVWTQFDDSDFASDGSDFDSGDEDDDEDDSTTDPDLDDDGIEADAAAVDADGIPPGLQPCNKFRDPQQRKALLAGRPVFPTSFSDAAKAPFHAIGCQPFMFCAFELERFSEIMGGIPFEKHVPVDELHVVRRCLVCCLFCPR